MLGQKQKSINGADLIYQSRSQLQKQEDLIEQSQMFDYFDKDS